MGISRLDHVAIPVIDMGPMVAFYCSLGFRIDDELAPLMVSVCAGDMKLNLHYPDLWQSDFELRGPRAEPGCGDVCMVWDGTEAELDTTDSYMCFVGGLPKERTWPWEYKAPFSPADIIQEYVQPARMRQNGKDVTMPALSDVELVHVPGHGSLEAFNTNGLRSLPGK